MHKPNESYRFSEQAHRYRQQHPAFAEWAAGYGVIQHSDRTQVRIYEKLALLQEQGLLPNTHNTYALLAATDRLTCASMWLVVHATYAKRVYLDGRDLVTDDFKRQPEGHTGGSLNMVPAYMGYLLANALTGITRSWLMGQGHCVAAIDATNVLVNNMTEAHAARYQWTDSGLSQFVQDFYSYAMQPNGRPASLLGSHVNPHTAGAMLEGGYLGFAELQYEHIPLPGERLVAFLSDGAFEEQRGSDWAPRWWRPNDTGLICPILIANGRRLEQRSTLAQEGGTDWLRSYLRLHQFDPVEIDGRDPADIAWSILEMEDRLEQAGHAALAGKLDYPVPMPYGIAETIKGYGFPGAGTNAAHNLPLGANPHNDEEARHRFNQGIRTLWVPRSEIEPAILCLNNHESTRRVKERDHACARRSVSLAHQPEPPFRPISSASVSPMAAIDEYFCEIVKENSHLRIRVGNPDELRSNGMSATLDYLKHRVTDPEVGVAEAIDGSIITALNEEAVICAALGNKAGLNLVVTYEAFAPKMLGAIRQELIFARRQRELRQSPGWLAVPLILTSHTWENGKNEQSHQDPTMCEALLGEMSDVSRVLFPADWNSALAVFAAAYQSQGEIWTVVVPKRPVPIQFSAEQARQLMNQGGVRVRGQGGAKEEILICAIGAYQLQQALLASDRLYKHQIPHSVVYLMEPARYREARDSVEEHIVVHFEQKDALFPTTAITRVFLSHTHPHTLLGLLRPLDTGPFRTTVLGYRNYGGTLDVAGMLFANRCTWAHALAAMAPALPVPLSTMLSPEELAALQERGDPHCLV